MLILGIVLASILVYVIIGACIFGYIAGRGETTIQRNNGYGYSETIRRENLKDWMNEGEPWAGAIFWPIYLAIKCIGILGPIIAVAANFGWRRGSKHKRVRKLRIELKEKLRAAQELEEKEAEAEIEGLLADANRRLIR